VGGGGMGKATNRAVAHRPKGPMYNFLPDFFFFSGK
jgi:hypothetical protein